MVLYISYVDVFSIHGIDNLYIISIDINVVSIQHVEKYVFDI